MTTLETNPARPVTRATARGGPRPLPLIAIFVGVLLAAGAAAVPNTAIERALLGAGAKSLSWGPTLFRAVLAVHGFVLAGAGLARLRARAETLARVAPPLVPPTPAGAWVALGLITAVAIGLRLYQLHLGLWYDEVLTLVRFVRPPIGHILTSFPDQNQHMLYSVMAHAAFGIFGEGAWALRLPAVIFGVLSIPAAFLLARHLFDVRHALLVAALMTVSYHHVWFSQNARGYSGVLFFTTTAAWLWLASLRRDRWGSWLLFSITVALGMWVHMTMLFVVAAMGLTYLVLLARSSKQRATGGAAPELASCWKPIAALMLAGTLTLQLYALGLPEFLTTGLHEVSRDSDWTNPMWLVLETLRGLHVGFAGYLVVAASAVVLLVGCYAVFNRDWVAPVIMVLPGIVLCTTMIAMKHNLWPRFVFFAASFAILFAVAGGIRTAVTLTRLLLPRALERLGLHLGVAGCLAVIAVSASTLPRCYNPKQDYAGARDLINAQRGPADAVVAAGMAGRMYHMYFAPEWPWVKTRAELDAARAGASGVWLVYTTPVHMKAYCPELWDAVQSEFEPVGEFPGTLGGGTVYVCRQKSPIAATATAAPALSAP